MRRSIFKAGVWTAFGLAVAFAIVSANSNTRPAATTAAPAAKATVATAASTGECTSSDVCCARETKVKPAAVAAAPKHMTSQDPGIAPGAAGMVVAIDPETGELGLPNAEQLAELRGNQVISAPQAGTIVQVAGGGVASTAVQEADYATVHIDAKGRMIFGHSDGSLPAQPAKPALEEK